jgi:hypothetical protein
VVLELSLSDTTFYLSRLKSDQMHNREYEVLFMSIGYRWTGGGQGKILPLENYHSPDHPQFLLKEEPKYRLL